MIFTDYYKFAELKPSKSHRVDCVAMSGIGHPTFETIAAKSRTRAAYFYVGGVPDRFSATAKRRADLVITNCNNISSVFVPDLNTPLLGYGDIANTNDAVIFVFAADYKQVELFIARGYKHNVKNLFTAFVDGALNGELETLRLQAKPTAENGAK